MSNIAYVSKGDGSIAIINADTYVVIATIPVGFVPIYIAITPDAKKAYLANQGNSSVSVLDLTSNTISAVIPLGDQPNNIIILPNRKRAYTGNIFGTISVIDTTLDKLISTLNVFGAVTAMTLSPDSKFIYASAC
jgi:YVTN family beta-propeller protein